MCLGFCIYASIYFCRWRSGIWVVYHQIEMLKPCPWIYLAHCFNAAAVSLRHMSKGQNMQHQEARCRPIILLQWQLPMVNQGGLWLGCLSLKQLWQERHVPYNDFRSAMTYCAVKKFINGTQGHFSLNLKLIQVWAHWGQSRSWIQLCTEKKKKLKAVFVQLGSDSRLSACFL